MTGDADGKHVSTFDARRYGPVGALGNLLERLRQIQGQVLVGIDGRMSAGKSTLARWLSEQLNWPFYCLDDSLKGDGSWHDRDAVMKALSQLKEQRRPIIVEGARLLETIPREHLGFLIFVEDEPLCPPSGKSQKVVERYLKEVRPREIADFSLSII